MLYNRKFKNNFQIQPRKLHKWHIKNHSKIYKSYFHSGYEFEGTSSFRIWFT